MTSSVNIRKASRLKWKNEDVRKLKKKNVITIRSAQKREESVKKKLTKMANILSRL